MKHFPIVLLCFLMFGTTAMAQKAEAVETFKLSAMKAAAEFLTSVKADNTETDAKTCKDCTTKEEILAFAAKHHSKGRKFEEGIWNVYTKKLPADADMTDIKNWQMKLINDLIVDKKRDAFASAAPFKDALEVATTIAEQAWTEPVATQPAPAPVPEKTQTESAQQVEEKAKATTDSPSNMPWIIAALGFVVAAGVYVWLSRKNASLEDKIRALNLQLVSAKPAEDTNKHAVELADLKDEVAQLKLKLAEAQSTLAKASTETTDVVEETPEVPQPVVEPVIVFPQAPPTDFAYRYAAAPENGGFAVYNLLDAPENSTVFEIALKNPTEASFELLNTINAHKRAVSQAGTLLEPVAEYEGAPFADANIVTVDKGLLRKEGDMWRVVQKIRVKFY